MNSQPSLNRIRAPEEHFCLTTRQPEVRPSSISTLLRKGNLRLAMSRALIVEDTNSDLRQSAAILQKLGFKEIDAANNVAGALVTLQDAVDGKKPFPNLVLLDLSFAQESGFELLRYWKSNKDSMRNTRIVVWTVMGETEQQLCRYFGVDVVPKWAGPDELEKVLRQYAPQQSKETTRQ